MGRYPSIQCCYGMILQEGSFMKSVSTSKPRRILSVRMVCAASVFLLIMLILSPFYLQRQVLLRIAYSTDVDQRIEVRLLEDPETRFQRNLNRASEIVLPAARSGNVVEQEIPAPSKLEGFTLYLAENSYNLFLNTLEIRGSTSVSVPGPELTLIGSQSSTLSTVQGVLKIAPNKNTTLCYLFSGAVGGSLRVLPVPLIYALFLSLLPAFFLVRRLPAETAHLQKGKVLFVFVVLFLLVFPVLKIDYRSLLSNENRFLAEYPDAFSDGGLNDRFPREFEKWFEDRCTMRTTLIGLEKRLFSWGNSTSAKENGDVLIGKKGWLFTTMANSIEMACNRNLFSEEQLKKCAEKLTELQSFLKKEYGARLYLVLLPDKERLYFENYPDQYKRTGNLSRLEQLTYYLRDNTDLAVVMPLPEMQKAKTAHQLYFMKGTHWTPHGALSAMRVLAERIHQDFPDFPATPANTERWVDSRDADVDLAVCLGYTDPLHQLPENALLFEAPVMESRYSVETQKQDGVYLLNRMVPEKTSPSSFKAFFCTDSFWWNALPFFTPLCGESLHLCCSAGAGFNFLPYREDLQKLRPDIVIMETTERFLDRFIYLENYGE